MAIRGNDKKLVMVVDDDSIARTTVSAVLRKYNYQVVEYSDGKSAIDAIKKSRPDIVLLDVVMPMMDGYQVCRKIREILGSDTVPVLMLTGLEDSDATDKAFNAGATDFISKPINWSLLSERVRFTINSYQMSSELREKKNLLEAAQKIARMGYWKMDLDSGRLEISGNARKILGLNKSAEVSLDELLQAVHPDDQYHVNFTVQECITNNEAFLIENRILIYQGQVECVVRQQGKIIVDGSGDHAARYLLGVIQDITEVVRTSEELEYKTYFDETTGLHNRHYFETQCRQYLKGKKIDDELQAVFFVHIGGVNKIVETLGHAFGDKLLRAIATRLEQFSRGGHVVGKFSNDMFSLLIKNMNTIEYCDSFARYVLEKVTREYVLDEHKIYISANIGISVYPIDSENPDDIIKYADSAVMSQKQEGESGFYYHTADMTYEANKRFKLENELRDALEKNQLRVFYQPQIDTHTLEITGMEALVRWIHPERGIVSPADFIPVAEETGLIVPIGNWVMQKACLFNKGLSDKGYRLQVGVNLSPQQFRDSTLIKVVEESLAATDLNPQLLDLEITESMAMYNVEDCIKTLISIKSMGVKTSMDDFGTGYSSLNYLQEMPLDTLKVDQSFIRRINSDDLIAYEKGNSKNAAIVAAIISMAKSLGLKIISEGVETEEQQLFLTGLGSDILQGFLFSKPLPEDEFVTYLNLSSDKKVAISR